MAISGANSYVQYGVENSSTFGTEAAVINSSFGHDVTMNIERKNNLKQARGLGSRNVKKFIEGKFEGTATVEGILGTTHWLAASIGTSASSGSAPYIHTYTETDTLPSISIEAGTNLSTDSVVKLLGCKLQTVTLTGTIDEPIRFSAQFLYKTETEGTTLDSTPAVDTEEPFNFSQMSVEIPDSSTLTRVQRFEITLGNELLQTYGLGSRFVSELVPGNRTHSFSMDKAFEDATQLELFYGSSTGPNATVAETSTDINITNGLAGANERHLQITYAGVKFDTDTQPYNVGEVLLETINATARAGTAIGQDNSATTVFD